MSSHLLEHLPCLLAELNHVAGVFGLIFGLLGFPGFALLRRRRRLLMLLVFLLLLILLVLLVLLMFLIVFFIMLEYIV